MPELTFDQWIQVINIAVLIITAAIIVWYTLETKRLRQEAQDQTKTLTDQLDQLRQEVEIQRSQLEIERERRAEEEELRMAEYDPALRFNDASLSGGRFIVSFYNAGGTIRDIDVRQANEVEGGQLSIDESEELKNGEMATITFASEDKSLARALARSPFVLEYTNIYGKRRERAFKYNGEKHIENL